MPRHNLTISAVIPAFNAGTTVRRSIESVLAQTQPVTEVLVVDDGSTDGTASVVEQEFPQVRLIRQPNSGAAAARNRGVATARGEWIAFLDADDAWLPEKLKRQSPLLQEPDVGIVHCYVVNEPNEYRYGGELTFERLWQKNLLGTSTVLLRKAAWETTGGFDEDRALMSVEDYNLWLRVVAQQWRVRLCPEELIRYTPADNNLSSQLERVLRAELLNVEKVAAIAGLPNSQMKRKRAQICAEYGRAFLHQRDLRQARRCLASALAGRCSLRTLMHWCATFAPAGLLDWRRQRIATN